jgi:hypothetical protein
MKNNMPEIFQDNNDILNSETMEDLFINIYFF